MSERDSDKPLSSVSLALPGASASAGRGSMLLTWLEVGRMLSSSSSSRQEELLARDSTILSLNRPVPRQDHYDHPFQGVCMACVCRATCCLGKRYCCALSLVNRLCKTHENPSGDFPGHTEGKGKRGGEGRKRGGGGGGGGARALDHNNFDAAYFFSRTCHDTSSANASKPDLSI